MRKEITIVAEKRTLRGKNEARRLRASGSAPAVLYGGGGDAVAVAVKPKEINRILFSKTGHNTIFDIAVAGGETSPVMIVDSNGKVRKAYVGRMKTEVRPLRLIEVAFDGDNRVNILMQDDWHVRIYSDDTKPLNITELKKGTRILGHVAQPGRHVGIKVSEHILES